MKIKKLIKGIPDIQVKGCKETNITGICINSKLVFPGNLFIARRGKNNDGFQYIEEAVSSGASAIATDIYDPNFKEIVQIIHPKVAEIEATLAACYYEFPSHELFTVGITGTNGKTTTSYLVKHLLDAINGPCGLIGTIEYLVGQHHYKATRTTPDACSCEKMLREMVSQGCKSVVMEASSHALDQGRVEKIDFDAAIFTNLTLDHLDYHETMERYSLAKQKLFHALNFEQKKKNLAFNLPKMAIVNIDDPAYKEMIKDCHSKVFTYGIVNEADLRAFNIQLTPQNSTFDLCYQEEIFKCRLPLIGRHNIYNFMATVAVGLMHEVPLSKILEIMGNVKTIPGRLEAIPNDLNLNIYVDFAHSDDALKNVLESLQQLKETRIITVFGCGGNRDVNKRSKMAKVSEQYSDIIIVTSDNPRNEDPQEICHQIIEGFSSKANYHIELDREKAINKAINLANPNDIILIAGKGHESTQIFAHHTIDFDDRLVTKKLIKK